MKITFLRSATLVLQSGDNTILLDPMLGAAGSLTPFSVFRHKARRNPLVNLPANAAALLNTVTHGLITHCQKGHFDHLDKSGRELLSGKKIPTYCREDDAKYLTRRGFSITALVTGQRQPFLSGFITPIPARHGHGWIANIMGPGVGYVIELPDEPSVYIAGDTVMTDDVHKVLTELKPDVAIVAAGNASVDVGQPILMSLAEVMEFVRLAPSVAVANHLEALNHCPVTRVQVKEAAQQAGLLHKLSIPQDGEMLVFKRTLRFGGFSDELER